MNSAGPNLSAPHLALKELRHDWQSAACFVAALVGVLAPLLLLLALKNGVIDALVGRLVENPSNREIIAMGVERFDPAFFAALAARSDVAFIMPATRRINAAATALRNPETRAIERSVPLIGSAEGDPLISGASVAPGQVWLSATLAETLALGAGQRVEMLIGREVDGSRETARVQLSVLGVLDAEAYGRQAMFLSLGDLLAVERFRDDPQISVSTYDTPRPAPQSYASFRLYARDVADLDSLQATLKEMGIQTRPRVQNATLLMRFRDSLNILYFAIAAVALAGFWASMSANLRGMVERQRVTFSLLRMLGMTPRTCARIPLVQSLIMVGAGVLVTQIIVLPALLIINATFTVPAGTAVAQLSVADLTATLAIGLFTAATASIWAVRAVMGIETDEVLRHG